MHPAEIASLQAVKNATERFKGLPAGWGASRFLKCKHELQITANFKPWYL